MKWLFWNSASPKASNIQFAAWSIPLKVRIVPIFTSNIMLLLINAWSCCYLFLLYKWCWSYFEVEDIFEFEKIKTVYTPWYGTLKKRHVNWHIVIFLSSAFDMSCRWRFKNKKRISFNTGLIFNAKSPLRLFVWIR